MGSVEQLIDRFDWAGTPIGPRDAWPQSLRTSLSICLASRFPILIWWGPQMIKLYNDAYATILGDKHPAALGAPGRTVWPEIWHIIGPMLNQVMREGKATWSDDQLLMLHRHGYPEECYFTFSYSPILDESGGVGGIFTAVTETTSRVVGERRLDALRQLAARASAATTVEQACRNAAAIIAANPNDVPWAALYLRGAGGRAEKISAVGRAAEESPSVVDWPDGATWTSDTVTLPLAVPGEEEARGLLVAGISPHRALDDEYRSFFTLVGGHISSAIVNAKAHEIERQRAESLAELDRAKTAFFANVSHEFRTPLTLMLGPLDDLLSKPDALSPAARQGLEVAHRNSLRLLKLVNTLLDFSRIEAGRADATYEPVDLAALTAELASVFRSAIERAGLRLVVHCRPLSEPVYADREMWEKIVLNLLSNALKFTFDGQIEVSLRQQDRMALLSVADTGTGIPANELPQLFERFHRVKNARGRTFEGSGIGLALVQELVKLHGGSVTVESEAGRGTTFTIAIPFGRAHLPVERIRAAHTNGTAALRSEAYVEEALRWLPDAPPQSSSHAAPADQHTVQPADHSAAHILVADDNADMRDYVRNLLGSSYDVETVADGVAALAAAKRQKPDLVLTDVMMPAMDGFALLRALRADEQTREVPVILLSARAGEESKVAGLDAGADDYLVKPFSARELVARVESHLRLQRVRREAQQALRESEARFREFADTAPAMLWIADADGSCSFTSLGWSEFTGQTEAEALGYGWLESIHPEDRVKTRELFLSANAEREPFSFDYRVRASDGQYRWAIASARPRFAASGEFIGYIGSVIDITDRKRAEQAKDEFLATLSHELRTPLTSGFGWVKLLRRTAEPELLEPGLRAIEDSLTNQINLIDDLLDVSRIAAGKLYVEAQPVDLAGVADAAVEMVRPAAQAKNLVLHVRHETVVLVRGDAARLEQVIWNLLTNAIKFTPVGGEVDVDVRQRGANAEVVVHDTGEGIDPKFLPHVFDRFRQADSSTSRRHGGLGLGLSIAASLVEAHNGTMRAESEGLGKGATFTVSIPLLEQNGAAVPLLPIKRSARNAKLQGARVVVVDDDEGARNLMMTALQSAGAYVRACGSAAEAYAAVSEWRPDILISDLAMPHEDGYTLIRRIREAGNLVPAVAITAYARAEDELRVREAGFQRHVTKPFDPDDLVNAVQDLT